MISTIISFHISVHLQVNSLEKVFEKWIKCKGRIKNNTIHLVATAQHASYCCCFGPHNASLQPHHTSCWLCDCLKT